MKTVFFHFCKNTKLKGVVLCAS